ncbi:MAG TPA: hydroxyacid dehydrogenase [Microbacteriaceae bacterium]|nr:hydroxyacid dehydrogenase [Microbacteriaceae bacterium]
MTVSKPTVALSESIDEAGVELLQQKANVLQFSSIEELVAAQKNAHTDAIIVRSITIDAGVMDAIPGLKVIGRHGAGLDNIDLEAAKARDIKVVNTPHSNTHSVAEYVIGAIYSMLKRFDETSAALREGKFTSECGSLPGQVQRMGLSGRELSSCTLGVVGYGAIGRAVAKLAEGNGMKIAFYDPFVKPESVTDKNRTQYASLEELLKVSDVVTLHVPGAPGEPPLIGAKQLELMKHGSYLVNAARGSIISIEAVTEALASGRLAGAAIDVYANEPPTLSADLLQQKNVLLTPHMAAMTAEALERMAVDVVTNTIEALS